MTRIAFGTRVRWKEPDDVLKGEGTIVSQPIGSTGQPPPGGCYVQWDALKEPMACFSEDIEPLEPR